MALGHPSARVRRPLTLLTLAIAVATLPGAAPARATTPGPNGRIAFAGETPTSSQIYTIAPDGSDLRQVTAVNGFATTPDWSPDGRRIAFELDDDAHAGIAVMNADGSDLHDLTPAGLQSQPAFTPDGRYLVYECVLCDGGDGIFIMRDDGSDAPGRRLSTNPFANESDANAQVSPDGGTVTFVRHQVDGQLQALFAVDISGANTRQLTPYTLEVAIKHDWAPDGGSIVITTHADFPNNQSPNLATIRPDGSHLHMLTRYKDGVTGAFAGSYSPDGRWIVYRVQRDTSYALWAIRANGGERRLLGTFAFAPRFIDWGTHP
jgi:Tol biopolymer transport system component